MKILMFGRGVIATIYGWALEKAGHEVEFYVRPGRAAGYGVAVELVFEAGRSITDAIVRESFRPLSAAEQEVLGETLERLLADER